MNTEAQALKVGFDGSSLKVAAGNTSFKVGSVSEWNACMTPYYPTYTWPTYIPYTVDRTVYRESKFDVAFKIVEKLMDKGHIKELTVKEFTKLVKEIADTL